MSGSRITLRIDRIVTDQNGLSKQELHDALHSEISAMISNHEVGALGHSTNIAAASATVASGKASLSNRVAIAAMKAVTR